MNSRRCRILAEVRYFANINGASGTASGKTPIVRIDLAIAVRWAWTCLLACFIGVGCLGCGPDDDAPEILVERARLFLDRGKPDDAIEMLDRVIKAWPESADAFFDRGTAHQQVGELETALEDFNRALQLDPEGSRVLNDRGVLLARLGRLDEAVSDFRRLLQLEPGDATGWINLGLVHHKQGNLEAALESYRRSTELRRDAESLFLEASVLFAQGDFKRAEETYSYVIEIESRWAKVWMNRGLCRLKLNQRELAQADFRRCQEVDDDMQFAVAISEVTGSLETTLTPAIARRPN